MLCPCGINTLKLFWVFTVAEEEIMCAFLSVGCDVLRVDISMCGEQCNHRRKKENNLWALSHGDI